MGNNLTKHAAKRISQRGVRTEALEAVMAFGDRSVSVGKGCTSLFLTRTCAMELSRKGLIEPWLVDRVTGLAVVVANDNDEVVTVVRPNGKRIARSYIKSDGYEAAWRQRRRA